nr:response regulator [Propylenella binzhouense]
MTGGLFRPSRSELPKPGAGQASPSRILIVEDEWFIAMESDAILRESGYTVVGMAMTADDAVELVGRERPDLVLMDIRLRGERDGIDAAIEIRERFGVACLFATAHSEAALRERGSAAAPAGWITKPFSEQQLLTAVQNALQARQ